MSVCDLFDSPDIELYFYNELDAGERRRVDAHLRGCAACRQRLDDLRAIRRALASRPVVDAPPAGDWSGFMRRLDAAIAADTTAPRRASVSPRVATPRRGWARFARATGARGLRPALAFAAMIALVTLGVAIAARYRTTPAPAPVVESASQAPAQTPAALNADPNRSLKVGTAEHLERSKLVVLGLATRDPQHTTAADWQYERQLAGNLLTDTRLYRLQAQDRGMTDVARVMRDLETVLIEASMADKPDRDTLERVQRLITKRDLVVKMQVVASSAGL
jgi:putative zinc finger protein